jgi:hypothetical protein
MGKAQMLPLFSLNDVLHECVNAIPRQPRAGDVKWCCKGGANEPDFLPHTAGINTAMLPRLMAVQGSSYRT